MWFINKTQEKPAHAIVSLVYVADEFAEIARSLFLNLCDRSFILRFLT